MTNKYLNEHNINMNHVYIMTVNFKVTKAVEKDQSELLNIGR